MASCAECGTLFPQKPSQQSRNKVWGSFCSDKCNSVFRSRITLGRGNPNSKGRNYDQDGYQLYTPAGKGTTKLHHYVTFEALGISKLPAGFHVHHRDCDVLNNDASNLQLISSSDHKWLHKEFGSATLWAIQHGKLDANEAASWSSDRRRAEALLFSNVNTQAALWKYAKEKGHSVMTPFISPKPIPVEFEVVEQLTTHEEPSNHSLGLYVQPGDRIAQACLVPAPMCVFEVVEQLAATERGAGGFGSSGRA